MAVHKTPGTGAGVFDNQLMFISSGEVSRGSTTALPSAGLKIRGTPENALAARIMIPDFPGTTMKITAHIQGSWDNSTYVTIASYQGGYLSKAANGTQEIMVPFSTTYPYVKLLFAFAGVTATWNFGNVRAGIVNVGHGDWSRLVRWD